MYIDYTRPIQLQDDFYISDYEFTEINKLYNLINYLRSSVIKQCSICKQIQKDQNKIKLLYCNCFYCEKCLIAKHNEATHNYKVLNEYEKATFPKTYCACSKVFDVNEYSQMRNDITQEDILLANQRMVCYIKTLCMFCKKKVNKLLQYGQLQETSPSKKVYIDNTNELNNESYHYETHYVCMQCYNERMHKTNNKEKDGSVVVNDSNNNNNTGCIKCEICVTQHTVLPKSDDKCYNVGCNLF
jgi:hypothetical protein